MTPYRIRRHRKRKHGSEHDSHMALIPFIDMLMILCVYLITQNSDVEVLPNSKNISIPESVAMAMPRPTVVVMVTKEDLLVDGRLVAKVSDLAKSDEALIAPLSAALKSQADRVLKAASELKPEDREVTIMGDRSVPYSILRKVMATCTDADYGKVSLAVIERERPGVAG
jgi:biopolymer transport protein TolR